MPGSPTAAQEGGKRANTVLIEAESFANHGGWKLDTQFIDIMGSPYLLAHGLGRPVENARTTVAIRTPGMWHVWVRTKNWVENASPAPGRFRLRINGQPLAHEFGAGSTEWGWERGGEIRTDGTNLTVELEDSTGFDGRCDAVLLTQNSTYVPDNSHEPMAAWRRDFGGIQVDRNGKIYDLVVVGGGLAGTSAAVAGARMGLDVALIQNRPVLGGNGSPEVRVAPRGKFPDGRYPHLDDIPRELSPWVGGNAAHEAEFTAAARQRRAVVDAEPTLDLFLNHHVYRVETNDKRIEAVWALDTQSRKDRRFAARYVVDATGHGTVGLKAGADYTLQPKGRMGASNLWCWEFVEDATPWPETPWALQLAESSFPYPSGGKGEWFWESGFDKHPLHDLEAIRDHNLRAVFGAWSAIKNHGVYAGRDSSGQSHARAALKWVAYISGTRETLQLLGDVIVNREDVTSNRDFADACVPATWSIDLHYPEGRYAKHTPDNPFISRAEYGKKVDVYLFPYRSFYSRNIENLFMAGRNISVTHEALGTVRVMNTLGMVGVTVGRAAAIAAANNETPRGVYEQHFDLLKEALALPGNHRAPVAPVSHNAHLPPRNDRPTASGRAPEALADQWELVGDIVNEPGYHIWGSSPIRDDQGRVHLFCARWPVSVPWEQGWRYSSEIAHYVAPGPEGPFSFVNVIGSGARKGWNAAGYHNPNVRKVGDRYVLVFISNDGSPRHGSNQRIGMMAAPTLDGPWTLVPDPECPLLSPPTDPEVWCYQSGCGVNNPSLLAHPDGKFYLYFKAMSGPRPRGKVKMGVAVAARLEGPYVILKDPITANETAIEDGYAFLWRDHVCLMSTDNHGILEKSGGLLWVSTDGVHFDVKPLPGFHDLRNHYLHGQIPATAKHYYSSMVKFERPQLLLDENGEPGYLYCPSGSALDGSDGTNAYLLKRVARQVTRYLQRRQAPGETP